MKTRITILILIIAGLVVWHYRDQIQARFQSRVGNHLESLSQSGLVDDLKKQIFTSGPLRAKVNAPNAFLTLSGVIEQTNLQRSENGKGALKENSKLNEAAQKKLQDMFDQQYFDHISPDKKGPSDLADEVGYEYIAVGENLALGNFKDDKALVEAWMNSPGHRANILNDKYLEIGVAVGKGTFEGKTTWLAVQEFGKPSDACPQVDESLKNTINTFKADVNALEADLNAKKSAIDSDSPSTEEEYKAHNQKVSEYNALVKVYNNKVDTLKQYINTYNTQVKQFNECATK